MLQHQPTDLSKLPQPWQDKLKDIPPLDLRNFEPDLRRYAQWVCSVAKQNNTWTYVVNGLGPHCLLLYEKIKKECALVILDKDYARMKAELAQYDYAPLFADKRVILLDTTNRDEAVLALGAIGDRLSRSVLLCPPYRVYDLSWQTDVLALLSDYSDSQNIALLTQASNSRKTAQNILGNLKVMLDHSGIDDLQNKFQGYPAVVIAAGPSAQEALEHLTPPQRANFVLIAAIPMLKPLLMHKIVPDFVVALDHDKISARFLEDLPVGKEKVHYIYEVKVNPEVVKQTPAGAKLSLLSLDWADALLGLPGGWRKTLPGGSTVAHIALQLAQFLGCDPIILSGIDLAFSASYYPACIYEAHPWKPSSNAMLQKLMTDGGLREVETWDGTLMYTDPQMLCYGLHFESMIKAAAQKIIDCSGGVKKHAVKFHEPIAAAIELYCDKIIEPTRWLYDYREGMTDEARTHYVAMLNLRLGQCLLLSELLPRVLNYYKSYQAAQFSPESQEFIATRLKLRDVSCQLSALTDIQPLLNHYDGALEIRKFWDESLIRLQGLADQEAFNAKFAHDERYLTALADAAGNMVTDLRACLELFAQEKTPPAGAG